MFSEFLSIVTFMAKFFKLFVPSDLEVNFEAQVRQKY